jgi:hypothetical protein
MAGGPGKSVAVVSMIGPAIHARATGPAIRAGMDPFTSGTAEVFYENEIGAPRWHRPEWPRRTRARKPRAQRGMPPLRPSRRRRVVPIPPPLVRAPVEHREAQNEERRLAADPWQNEGWVSAQPNGKPTDPS